MHGKHLFKILGLAMLVATAAMAVSASAAQAKWLILENETSLLKAELNATINGGNLQVPALGLKLECVGGTATATLETEMPHTVLEGTGGAKFTGCDVNEFEEFCEVKTAGQPDGTIVASGSGEGQMEGAKIFAVLESEEFANVIISDPLEICPFTNIDGRVNGSVTLTLDEPGAKQKAHGVKLDDAGLFYGKDNPATLEGEGGGAVTGSAELSTEEPWAIELVGL